MLASLGLLIPALLCLQSTAHCQAKCRSFTERFGGAGNDWATTVGLDPAGDLYLLGATESFPTLNLDALLVKCSASGSLLWARSWGGALADDFEGNALTSTGILFSGSRSGDALLVNLSLNGAYAWGRTWDSGGSDHTGSVFEDSRGNIYLAGGTTGWATAGSDNALLIKYDSSGSLLHARYWDAIPSSINQGVVHTPSQGSESIYVVGNAQSWPMDLLVQKYDASTLKLVWSRTWAHGTGNDDGWGMVVDSQENIYTVGTYQDSTGSNQKALVVKWDRNGKQLWSTSWSGQGLSSGLGHIAIGPNGDLYATGETNSYTGSKYEGLILKLSPNGQVLWSRTWTQGEYLSNPTVLADRIYVAGVGQPSNACLMTRSGAWKTIVGTVSSQIDSGQIDPLGPTTSTIAATPSQAVTNNAVGGTDVILFQLCSATATATTYGSGCAGTNGIPSISPAAGFLPQLGSTFRTALVNAPKSGPFPAMLFGPPLTTPINLDLLGMTGCKLYLTQALAIGFSTRTHWDLVIPCDAVLLGGEFSLQAALFDAKANPFGLTSSNAMSNVVGF